VKGIVQIFKLTFIYKRTALFVILSNLLFVIFNLLSLVLFIPFLKIIFAKPVEGEELEPILEPVWDKSGNMLDYFGEYFEFLQYEFVDANGKLGALQFVCISVLIAFFLKNLFRYIAVYNQSFLRMAVVRDLRRKLFDRAMHLPLSFYSEEKKGNLLTRLTADLNEVEIAVVSTLELVFREPLAIAVNLIILFYLSPELTTFSLILLPISALVISRIRKSLKRTSQKGQEQMSDLVSNIEESLGGIRVIKAFTAEKIALDRFSNKNKHHQSLITRTFRKKDLASPLNEVFGAAVLIAIVWFGGKLVLAEEGGMSGEQLIAFIVIFSQFLRPISSIASALTYLKKAEVSLDRVNEIINIEDPIKDPENPVQKTGLDSEISFNNVGFSYDEEPILKNISFKLEKGKTVALVGESGSGKSTLSDLIPRFHDVSGGEILIDNINIRALLKKDLRKLISVVTQESILFNDSVRNNISFGNPDATEEEIINAAKVANAHEFISQLENGYNTIIGDRGNKLSGGQKQRVSIARAVLSKAPIMILDEATSALDTESEKLVQDALENLMQNRTSLIIAHRLSTIRHADLILVLKNGEVVERGNHNELIAAEGYYKSLCDIQQVI
jgi:subfamily B ATP-binding cassette protein MsbA